MGRTPQRSTSASSHQQQQQQQPRPHPRRLSFSASELKQQQAKEQQQQQKQQQQPTRDKKATRAATKAEKQRMSPVAGFQEEEAEARSIQREAVEAEEEVGFETAAVPPSSQIIDHEDRTTESQEEDQDPEQDNEQRGEDDEQQEGGGDEDEVDEAEAYRQQGNAEYQRGRYEAAIELYTKSIEANPRRSLGYSNRAAAQLRLLTNNQLDLHLQPAYQDALQALRLDPTNAKAHAHVGRCRFLMCNFGDAQKAFEKGRRLEMELEQQGQQGQQPQESCPSSSSTTTSSTTSLNAKGVADCQRATLLLAECRSLVGQRRYGPALGRLDALTGEYPELRHRPSVARTRSEILEQLGLQLHDEGRYQEAGAAMTSAIDLIEGTTTTTTNGSTTSTTSNGNTTSTSKSSGKQQQQQQREGLAAMLANRASARKRSGDLPGAVADCLRCLAIDPTVLAARARLAHILVELQEYDEALRILDEAPSSTDPSNTNTNTNTNTDTAGGSGSGGSGGTKGFSDYEAAKGQLGAERLFVQRSKSEAMSRFPFGGKDHARLLGLPPRPQPNSNSNWGVAGPYPEAEVRQAYKRLALLWHPDKAAVAAATGGRAMREEGQQDKGHGRPGAADSTAAVKDLSAKVFRSVQTSYQRLLDGWRPPAPPVVPPQQHQQPPQRTDGSGSGSGNATAAAAAFRSRSAANQPKPFAFGSSEYRRAEYPTATAHTYPQPSSKAAAAAAAATMFV